MQNQMQNQETTIRFDRLLELAEHLESGQLGHKKFYFRDWTNSTTAECGTAGCAIGECPVVWPEDWFFYVGRVRSYPMLRAVGNEQTNSGFHGMEWFGLLRPEFEHLFLGEYQQPQKFGGEELDDYATKDQVAANIRAFCEKMQEQQA